MKMQVMRCLITGSIQRIFNMEAVDVIEVSDCGMEILVTLRSGHSFRLFEPAGHHNTTIDEVMEKMAEKYKLLSSEAKNDA